MQADPLGFVDGPSVYAYAGNNPIAGSDPLGLWSTGAHNDIIDHAFPNLSDADRKGIKSGSGGGGRSVQSDSG
jgi:uncharacterized protein RhaS with RHS repeats